MKNYRTNKQRITALLLSLSCILCTAGCTDKGPDSEISSAETSGKSSEASADEVNEESPDLDLSFPEETEPFELPELSDEIPADAVTKVTITTEYRDEITTVSIEYRNDHDDPVLIINVGSDGEETADENLRYEYNDKGDPTYKYDLEDYQLSETYYEYDDKGREINVKNVDDGIISWEKKYKYDEYDNIILEDSSYYKTGTDELLSNVVSDYSDCDYDDNGNRLTVRSYTASGTLFRTEKYTYDSENRILTEVTISENTENGSYKRSETHREYDPASGKECRTEDISYNPDGSVYNTMLYEREFDSSDRLVHVTSTYKDEETENVTKTTYEYEEL